MEEQAGKVFTIAVLFFYGNSLGRANISKPSADELYTAVIKKYIIPAYRPIIPTFFKCIIFTAIKNGPFKILKLNEFVVKFRMCCTAVLF